MTMGRNDKPQAAWGPNLWDMLQQIGFPPPQQLLQEMQRFNVNLERLGPDVHKLADASQAISRLATAVEGVNPADIQQLTQALEEASRTGEKLQQRLWGNR
jgi:ABC-type transporter Mla subunit MlaD